MPPDPLGLHASVQGMPSLYYLVLCRQALASPKVWICHPTNYIIFISLVQKITSSAVSKLHKWATVEPVNQGT